MTKIQAEIRVLPRSRGSQEEEILKMERLMAAVLMRFQERDVVSNALVEENLEKIAPRWYLLKGPRVRANLIRCGMNLNGWRTWNNRRLVNRRIGAWERVK